MPNGDANENSRKKSYLPKKNSNNNNNNKTRLCFCFFSSKSPGGHAIYR